MVSRGPGWAILAIAFFSVFTLRVSAQVTETTGFVVFEAEDFNSNLSARSGHDWTFGNAVSGFSGIGYMEATPNNGANLTTANSSSPELQFTVNFTSTGTHYIWIRGYGGNGNDDSIHVGIDGGSAVAMTLTQFNAWHWTNSIQGAAGAAAINVPTTGNHTINVWMREDGVRIDRLILTTNPNFATHTGNVWHIPSSTENGTIGGTMRNPLNVNPGTPATISTAASSRAMAVIPATSCKPVPRFFTGNRPIRTGRPHR